VNVEVRSFLERISCAHCGELVAFGEWEENKRFCNQTCRQAARTARVAAQIPETIVSEHAWRMFQGSCPSCGGPGPVDVHLRYRIWSVLVVSSWSTQPTVACRRCGQKARFREVGFCLLFGWWGLPWGPIGTPIQICRNLAAILRAEETVQPSGYLRHIVSRQLAAGMLDNGEHR
jgi:hypothetical protein